MFHEMHVLFFVDEHMRYAKCPYNCVFHVAFVSSVWRVFLLPAIVWVFLLSKVAKQDQKVKDRDINAKRNSWNKNRWGVSS